jgi:hypothetical protein
MSGNISYKKSTTHESYEWKHAAFNEEKQLIGGNKKQSGPKNGKNGKMQTQKLKEKNVQAPF